MTNELKEVSTNKDAAEQLKRYVEAIENYDCERQELTAKIKEVFDEAKATGFDAKIMRKVITLRKKNKKERQEEEFLLTTYKDALGIEG